jgi:hypothetical protein
MSLTLPRFWRGNFYPRETFIMTKILNIDAIGTPESRVLEIAGVQYVVRPMSVEDYVLNSEDAEAIRKEANLLESIQRTMKMVRRAIPGLSEDVLKKQTMDRLQAIVAFIRGAEPEELMRIFSPQSEVKAEERGK